MPHVEVSWCAVYMYSAAVRAPEDGDDSTCREQRDVMSYWCLGRKHAVFLAGDGHVPLFGK